MKIEEHQIKILKTGRYYSNKPECQIKTVLIAIHGYAQLAGDFLNDFNFLNNKNSLVIAPEGLSKFYSRNKIGASWMTKEDRINEINDYLGYLDKVFDVVKNKFDISGAGINILGFSQGGHTAARWFIHNNFSYNNLILCSSDFPRDADFEKLKLKVQKSKLNLVYGKYDDIIDKKTFDESKNLLKVNGVEFEEFVFEGKHEINTDSLIKILNK